MMHVGLIGHGYASATFHIPLINKAVGLQLQAIYSSKAVNHSHAAVVSDVNEVISRKDIDVIVVVTPNMTHYELAKKAIAAGKHVVVEKPFTVTSAQADELIDLARQKGVLLTVFQNRRWDNDFLTVQELLRTEVLGKISMYEAHYDRFRPNVRQRWREQNIPGSGILYDLGAHLIDQALTLFQMPKTIWADVQAERTGAEAVDYFHLVLGYDDKKVILHAGSIVREPGPKVMVHGTRGSFIKYGLDSQEDQLKKGMSPGDPGWGEDEPGQYGLLTADIGGMTFRGTVETLPGRYEVFYEQLSHALTAGSAVPVLPEESRNTIRIIEYAMQSQREQKTIQIS